MAFPAVLGWKAATSIFAILSAGAAGALVWEKMIDDPDIGTVNNYGPDWKGYAVLGLAAAGGFYLASRVVK